MRMVSFPQFRTYIDEISKFYPQDGLLIKLVYLLASRCCEVATKKCPSDQTTTPLGDHLNSQCYSLANIRLNKNHVEKVLLIKAPIAKRKNKRKHQAFKIIPLPCNLRYEPWIIDILKHLKTKQRLSYDYTRQHIYRIITRRLQPFDETMTVHTLRHLRLTHLAVHYDFTPYEVSLYAGWKLSSTYGVLGQVSSPNIDTYLHLAWKQYVTKLFIPIHDIMGQSPIIEAV